MLRHCLFIRPELHKGTFLVFLRRYKISVLIDVHVKSARGLFFSNRKQTAHCKIKKEHQRNRIQIYHINWMRFVAELPDYTGIIVFIRTFRTRLFHESEKMMCFWLRHHVLRETWMHNAYWMRVKRITPLANFSKVFLHAARTEAAK